MSILEAPNEEQIYPNMGAKLTKKTNNHAALLILLAFLCFAGTVGWFHYRLKKIEHRQRKILKSGEQHRRTSHPSQLLGQMAIPGKLTGIPFGEDLGIVLDVLNVNIRNVRAPYNPGILKTKEGYDLFFRYDLFDPKLKYTSYTSNIGVVHLNHQFKQLDREFKRLDLQNKYSEDPRILSVDNQLYLFYNQMEANNPRCRFMCVANLEPDTYDVNYTTVLDMNLQWIEKNWSPFEYIGPDQKRHLCIEYKICPRKIIELPNPQINQIKNIQTPANMAYLNLSWTHKWGGISGGTPAVLIGEEYLGFFHSWFVDEHHHTWYVMGAYTFAAQAPFHITGISPHPILFKEIYETPPIHTASPDKRVIFPSGFVIGKKNDQDLIYLACGENDSGIKIVIIDQESLIHSLERFETKEKT